MPQPPVVICLLVNVVELCVPGDEEDGLQLLQLLHAPHLAGQRGLRGHSHMTPARGEGVG